MTTRILHFASLLVAALLLSGCVTYERSYPGRTSQQLWTAMVSVAEQPDYTSEEWGPWHVMANDVYVEEGTGQIEISRHLRRVVYKAGMVKPDEQERTYLISISLRQSVTPKIKFSMRGMEIPADAFTESQRYFDDVGDLLDGMPVMSEPAVSEAADAVDIDSTR